MEQNKSNYSIKGKLISAIAMLLVATIMVVSSTYAWFTLSTAPEVKGVSTAVGANGALEMLLATKDGEGNWVYESGQVSGAKDRNTYWGNLVDFSNRDYGQNAITLLPSTINLSNEGKLSLLNPLQTPVYGADGRVESLSPNVISGLYSGTAFLPEDNYGFRGLGVVSGLTERQQAFRAAISAIATAQYNAQTAARSSLSQNGTPLANIAIMKAMSNSADEKIFSDTDVEVIGSMVTGVESALKEVENAYVEAIVAYALGNALGHANDDTANALAVAIRNAATGTELNAKLTAVFATLETEIGSSAVSTLQTALSDYGYDTYVEAVEDVTEAKTAYSSIAAGTEFSWNDIRDALTPLVNVSNITINDVPASEVSSDEGTNKIASDILGSKGVWVNIPTGGGVYADIADLAGDYTVDIEVDSDNLANGMVSGLTIKAKMNTASEVSPEYLSVAYNALNVMPGGESAGARPLTEFYGYVIDLAFRTNAAQSNLLLQTDAIDRIYTDNSNEETMGSGSTMTFKSSDVSFDNSKVKARMSNIRVVFYGTEGDANYADIYATAKLDLENDVIEDANGVTAKLYLFENAEATKATYNGATVYKYDGKYYNSTLITDDALVTIPDGESATDSAETVVVEVRSNVITSLDQGVAKHISAMVYLEGETIENSDVAATMAQSMTGTVNFQFASSATLVPMEYGNLHTPQN